MSDFISYPTDTPDIQMPDNQPQERKRSKLKLPAEDQELSEKAEEVRLYMRVNPEAAAIIASNMLVREMLIMLSRQINDIEIESKRSDEE